MLGVDRGSPPGHPGPDRRSREEREVDELRNERAGPLLAVRRDAAAVEHRPLCPFHRRLAGEERVTGRRIEPRRVFLGEVHQLADAVDELRVGEVGLAVGRAELAAETLHERHIDRVRGVVVSAAAHRVVLRAADLPGQLLRRREELVPGPALLGQRDTELLEQCRVVRRHDLIHAPRQHVLLTVVDTQLHHAVDEIAPFVSVGLHVRRQVEQYTFGRLGEREDVGGEHQVGKFVRDGRGDDRLQLARLGGLCRPRS